VMGDGMRDLYESTSEEYLRRRIEKINQLGPHEVAFGIKEVSQHIEALEKEITAMSRSGWFRLDKVKEELRKLSI